MRLFAVGWVDITPAEAMEMGLEQAARLRWQMWRIELFGFGICFRVRPKHQLRDALR